MDSLADWQTRFLHKVGEMKNNRSLGQESLTRGHTMHTDLILCSKESGI